MELIFRAAKRLGFEVFISPHYFYPEDKGWKFNGPLETDEANSGLFARKGVLNLDGLRGSGAALRGPDMPAPVVGDHPEALAEQEHHLRVPIIGRQRPAVAKHYGLTLAPVLVEDLNAFFGGDRAHIFLFVVPFTWFCFDPRGLS